MTRPITQETVEAIVAEREATGKSYRKLAKHFDVSRGTVGLIVRYPTDWRKREREQRQKKMGFFPRPVPEYYCDGCHAYVKLSPCPACYARKSGRVDKVSG